MEISLKDQEHIVRETEANHYIEEKLMIGRLHLTNTRLVFQTHIQNFSQYNIDLPLERLSHVTYRNNLGLFSHGICVHENDGTVHCFSVWSRRKWKEAIEGLLAMQQKIHNTST